MSAAPFPGANVPAVTASTGFFSYPWLTFFQRLASQPSAISPVTVGASPFSYTAGASGFLNISGGTVSSTTLTRAGTTITADTPVPVANNDVVTITYSVKPTVSFIPA